MATSIRDRLLDAFRTEHVRYLDAMRSVLANGTDAVLPAGMLGQLRQAVRGFREAASAAELPELCGIARSLEGLLRTLREDALLPVEVAAALRLVIDAAALAQVTPTDTPAPARLEPPAVPQTPAPAGRAGAQGVPPGQKILAAFRIESREHLESVRAFLERARTGAAGPGPALDDAFRRVHSLKGAARACDLTQVETLSHRLETLLSRVRAGVLGLDAGLVVLVGRGLDAIEDAIVGSETSVGEVLADLDACLTGRTPANPPPIAITMASPFQQAPGTAAPAAARSAEPPVRATPDVQAEEEAVRVSPRTLDQILATAAEITTQCLQQERFGRELLVLQAHINELHERWQRARGRFAAQVRRSGAQAELQQTARDVDGAEHATRALARQARELVRQQRQSGWALKLQAERMQVEVREARRIPVEAVFQGCRKMVRDLARDAGRKVDFQVSGFHVQADRVVLQALKDPLMHILRNAIAHGIETPGERIASGKPEVGVLRLEIQAEGSRLSLRVTDDGRGIDSRQVARAALAAGLIGPDEAERTDRARVARLIFAPGLSTAGSVSDLAGRGMGLSVVEEAVRRLHGEIEVPCPAGPGTVFAITVPATISTHRVLLFACGGQTFALPASTIVRLVRPESTAVRAVGGEARIAVDGEELPVIDLASALGLAAVRETDTRGRILLAILRTPRGRVAASVDRLIAERDALIKELDESAVHDARFDGAVQLEDGALALVVDPAWLDTEWRAPRARTADARAPEPAVAPEKHTILVVDDSFTTRTLETSLLEAHGFRVHVAVDGVKALEELRSHAIDLVITDWQMPNLDGCALVAAMKRDPSLAAIPVIMVTSLDQPEQRARGLEVGADAYVVKQRFDHQELLQTIAQLL